MKIPMLLGLESPDYLSLRENGEAFVEPEMFPAAVGHQVAGPTVCDLVGDHLFHIEREININVIDFL